MHGGRTAVALARRSRVATLSAPAVLGGLDTGLADRLTQGQRRWLVTGSAGFIGSNLLELLLSAGQSVVSLDNFATGHRRNLDLVRASVGEGAWARHRFIEGDIADPVVCAGACQGVDIVLH